jgi:hypothetical protein
MGKTVQIACNSATPTNANVTADSPVQQYMLANHSNQPVYVWISPSANPVNVAVPNATVSQYAVVVPPTSSVVITGPQCSATPVRASAIAESDSPEVYITPGEGL